jgi:hypothetical protein
MIFKSKSRNIGKEVNALMQNDVSVPQISTKTIKFKRKKTGFLFENDAAVINFLYIMTFF